MTKSERIVRYTADELEEMRRRGESLSDWARVDAMTEEELEASIDPEDEGEVDHSRVWLAIPGSGQEFYLPLEQDVAAWFLATGPGWPARITAVLRDYVDARQRDAAAETADPVSRR